MNINNKVIDCSMCDWCNGDLEKTDGCTNSFNKDQKKKNECTENGYCIHFIDKSQSDIGDTNVL